MSNKEIVAYGKALAKDESFKGAAGDVMLKAGAGAAGIGMLAAALPGDGLIWTVGAVVGGLFLKFRK